MLTFHRRPEGVGVASMREIYNFQFRRWIFIKEIHDYTCACSYCRQVATFWFRTFVLMPRFRYWHKGWFVFGLKTSARIIYWRFA